MENESFQALTKNSPFIAWIHNISLNQQKYLKSKFKDLNFGHDVRYIMFIYDNPNCSQEDIANMFSQSKGNIAKVLKKLEDLGYVKREIDPNNRRKYMLNVTEKGQELVPKFREVSRQWEREVGITDSDDELKERIKEIAISAMNLIEEK